MGNAQSVHKNIYCTNYQHSNIVNAIYAVLSNYQIEAMCDCASWLLRELLISHKNYKSTQIELLCSIVNGKHHVFVLDKKYNYYIDITSEQFVDKQGKQIETCLGSESIEKFIELGYDIDLNENTKNVCDTFCKETCVLFDDTGKEITRHQLLAKVKLHLGIKGGKRKRKSKKR